jgi:hypothetical protein
VRFNQDDSCVKKLHRVDWETTWDVRKVSNDPGIEKAGVVDSGTYTVTAVVDEQVDRGKRKIPVTGGPFPNDVVTKKPC